MGSDSGVFPSAWGRSPEGVPCVECWFEIGVPKLKLSLEGKLKLTLKRKQDLGLEREVKLGNLNLNSTRSPTRDRVQAGALKLAELPLHFFPGYGSSHCGGASWSCCEAIRRMREGV